MKIFHSCLCNADFIPASWIWTSITWSLTRWKQIALQVLRSGNWSQFQLTSAVLCVPHIPVNHILKCWAGMSCWRFIISATKFYFWNQLSEAKMLNLFLYEKNDVHIWGMCGLYPLYLRTDWPVSKIYDGLINLKINLKDLFTKCLINYKYFIIMPMIIKLIYIFKKYKKSLHFQFHKHLGI